MDARKDEAEVVVWKNGREVDRIRRPLRVTPAGPAVTYRHQLWLLRNGIINLDEAPVDLQPKSDPSAIPLSPVDGPDPAQQKIIHRPVSDRLIVDAGPGTGKTHVACARVAALISSGTPPSRIWLISFTRTAVYEIRNRIATALSDPADAAAVCIATLDSHAWSLQSGFNSGALITGSFDENIEATARRVREDDELREYLATRVRHIVIDEGQDIVGVRAELTLALIRAVADDCGITVFADEAQAIYGFSDEDESQAPDGPTFIDRLRASGFEELSLQRIWRTARPGLMAICGEVRQKVLRRSGSAATRRAWIDAEVRAKADASGGSLTHAPLDQISDDGLVLARRRVDVLLLSSLRAAVPHRLRLSGLPACLKPWIAHLLWDWTQPLLTRPQFELRWGERSLGTLPGSPAAEEVWRLMVEVAGQSEVSINLGRLREVLGRSGPPMLFCAPEFGSQGPVIGTIHASKGREADYVALYLPRVRKTNSDASAKLEEEIRVILVGATRARKSLLVGHATRVRAASMHGRVWRGFDAEGPPSRIQIEVGRSSDITPEGLVGRRSFIRPEDAHAAQTLWRQSPVRQGLHARTERSLNWEFVLETAAGLRVGVLGPQLKSDLREISRVVDRWPPPDSIPYLRSLGARTLVLAPDDSRLELLHEPWRTSGFLAAPLLIGFSTCDLGGKYD